MRKIAIFTVLLIAGLIFSQLSMYLSADQRSAVDLIVKNGTLICLAFVMIHVGLEFTIDKNRLGSYAWDYFVAFTAATFPWIFCTLYFVYSYDHQGPISKNIWTEALLLGRFASPTSAGVLFTMLAAAGLATSWVFKKARILAIFDDLDTIILLIPIKMMIIGFRWELLLLVAIMALLIIFAWKKMHRITLPLSWPWVLGYAVGITTLCELVHYTSSLISNMTPLDIEILLPAFVWGCVLSQESHNPNLNSTSVANTNEDKAQYIISALFMFLVGASMPPISLIESNLGIAAVSNVTTSPSTSFWDYQIGTMPLSSLAWDVLILTLLSNLGKMFPLFCYRSEVSLRERLALSLGMCPRGEVGAGVIVISLGLITHLQPILIIAAMLSLTLNLLFTGPLIMLIKLLLDWQEDKKIH